jgi:hypothetical protein
MSVPVSPAWLPLTFKDVCHPLQLITGVAGLALHPSSLRTVQTGQACRAFAIHLSTSTILDDSFGSFLDFGLGFDFIGASVSTFLPAFASALLLTT